MTFVVLVLVVALVAMSSAVAVLLARTGAVRDQLRRARSELDAQQTQFGLLRDRRSDDERRRDFWEQFVCGCGHHYVYHERSNDVAGECEHAVGIDRATLADAIGQRFKDLLQVERPCRCQGYVGPLPPSYMELGSAQLLRDVPQLEELGKIYG